MKRLRQLLVALSLMVIGVQVAQAQVKLGDNPGTIDANALLELESTSKGFLLPRMSTVQRLAISSPAEGMMVYDLTASCTYIYRDATRQWYSLCAADSLTASNGLTKVGRDVQLGGTLTQTTNIAQAGNNLNITGNGSLGVGTNAPNATTRADIEARAGEDPLRLGGLRTGASTDSIMTVDAASGILRKRTLADVLQDQDEYVWKLDGNLTTSVRSLGTKSNYALPIITNNVERMRIAATGEVGIGTSSPTNKLTVEASADPLKLVGLQTAAQTDSLLTVDFATGVVRKITIDSVASRGIVAENAITKEGNIVRLGGNLNRATTIGASGANTIAITGLQTAAMTDSLITQDAATGILRKITIDSVASRGIVAENGVNKEGNIVRLGGTLNRTTTVAQATNDFAFTGGKVGVGAATPNSTLQVGGSVAVPISVKSSGYTMSVDDHTIIGDCTSGGFTLTLPSAASCVGRTYIIIKGDATTNVLTFSSAIRLSLSQTMPSVNYNVRLHVQSDGTDWWLVARF
jgi:hypothetical protein